jgi:hypothetical protein
MITINDTFTMGTFTRDFSKDIPEPNDVHAVLPPRIAALAVALFACKEEYIRENLRIGSTPPTVSVIHITKRQKFIQNTLYRHFGEMIICKD